MKVACRRDMAANFIKNRILEPKENLRMIDGGIEIYFKKTKFEEWFTIWSLKELFPNIREERMRGDTRLLGSMPKSDHDNQPSYEWA